MSKLAVERNRIKRQIRDSFRHYLETELSETPGTDFVLVAKSTAKGAEKKEIRKDLDVNWDKALKQAKSASGSARRPPRSKKPQNKASV